ncbi:hypothetical protein PV403_12165 [Paenibacillus sp. GYB006]
MKKLTVIGILSWNNENGYMITAPASNRVEAIRLSNDLMEQFLQGLVLK